MLPDEPPRAGPAPRDVRDPSHGSGEREAGGVEGGGGEGADAGHEGRRRGGEADAGPASAEWESEASPTPFFDVQPPRRPTLPRGANLGRYVLLDLLGSGGMGEVYSAYDPDLDRKVTIKVLHADLSASGAEASGQYQELLLREAQAMAKLSHPNVIAVHDVGVSEGRVFFAMEFVAGETLRAWQAREGRQWREVLATYMAAGRGLAAAHAASLVHRDFKPDNVLVADDGRVKVTDFGIAHALDGVKVSATGARASLAPPDADRAVVGTPGYMAPEQYLGQPADPRTDQFSFCVALYRALYGRAPFADASLEATRRATLAGQLRPPPKDARTPAWVFRVLARGLRASVDERYASMDELLAALGDDPGVRRRKRAFTLAAVLLPAAAAVGAYRLAAAPRADPCVGGEQRAEEAWGPRTRAEAERAFGRTGKPYAADAWRQARTALDAYGARWAAAHREVCEATKVRHEQTAERMALRMECLEARRRDLAALGRVFAEADAEVVERAAQAARSLGGLEACARAVTPAAAEAPPESPAMRDEIEALRADLSAAGAYLSSGKYRFARELSGSALEQARRLGHPALRAEALELRGRAESQLGDFGAAAATFKLAARAAGEARAEGVEARARLGLAFAFAELGQFEAAHDWADYAGAFAKRLPDAEAVEVERLSIDGWTFFREGKFDRAAAALREALAASGRSREANPETLALLYNRLGNILGSLRRVDDALKHLEREDELITSTLGAEHPERARNFADRANVFLATKRYEEAISLLVRAVALGPGDGSRHAIALANLGEAYEGLGKYHEASEHYERARAIVAASPSQTWLLAAFEVRRGRTLARLGRVGEGLGSCEEGLRLAQSALPPDHEFIAEALECVGTIRASTGLARSAIAPLERALSIRQALADEEKTAAVRALLDAARAGAH
ncbi:MAG TPA: serine/threonine-protein kinase [Polyangiaceae bacterium]|nr:serine/threonine-protein kinase [Polyangiaceae bacterium]